MRAEALSRKPGCAGGRVQPRAIRNRWIRRRRADL